MARLSAGVLKAIAEPAVQQALIQAGVEPTPMDSRAFAWLVTEERARWKVVIQAGKITQD